MRHVYVVCGRGFGDNEDAWEVCGVYANRNAAVADVAEWNADEVEEYGHELEYKIEQFPLVDKSAFPVL